MTKLEDIILQSKIRFKIRQNVKEGKIQCRIPQVGSYHCVIEIGEAVSGTRMENVKQKVQMIITFDENTFIFQSNKNVNMFNFIKVFTIRVS